MRFDLKTPCKNCPFRNDATAIRFRTHSRAEEIAESAYRNGFPCHLSAKHEEEDDDGEGGGFVFGDATQHCVGALMLFARHDDGTIPFSRLPEAEQEAILKRIDWKAPVYEDETDFLDSYGDAEAEEADEVEFEPEEEDA